MKTRQRNELLEKERESQIAIGNELFLLARRAKGVYKGVWRSPVIETLESIGLQLQELAENNICPDIYMSWQPSLLRIFDDEENDPPRSAA